MLLPSKRNYLSCPCPFSSRCLSTKIVLMWPSFIFLPIMGSGLWIYTSAPGITGDPETGETVYFVVSVSYCWLVFNFDSSKRSLMWSFVSPTIFIGGSLVY